MPKHERDRDKQVRAAIAILAEHLGTVIVLHLPSARAQDILANQVNISGVPTPFSEDGHYLTPQQRAMLTAAVKLTAPKKDKP